MTGTRVTTLLAKLVEERCGLHYRDVDRKLLVAKLSAYADDQGFESLLDAYYALRYDDPEGARFAALADALVVGETYFFREPHGLQRVVETVQARAAAGRRSRVWCAGCATGEEALSLAVMLAEAGVHDEVDIVATDLSVRHVERARRGEFGRRTLRFAPEGRPPWLLAAPGGPVVAAGVRERIDWRVVNLLDPVAVAALGTFDAILCRNVMIYFAEATVRRLATTLAAALAPDGILVIGASESLLRTGTVLACVERSGSFLYVRSPPPALRDGNPGGAP